MFKRFLKWLGFRRRRPPHGELCPNSGEDYLFVCDYAQDGECRANLRQQLDCALNDEKDLAAIRKVVAETEEAFRGK